MIAIMFSSSSSLSFVQVQKVATKDEFDKILADAGSKLVVVDFFAVSIIHYDHVL